MYSGKEASDSSSGGGAGGGGESTFFMGLLTENSTKLELYLNYKEPGAKNKLMRWECFLYTNIHDMQCSI